MPSQDELYGLLEEDDPGLTVTAQRSRSVPKVDAAMGLSAGGDPDIEAALAAPDRDEDIEAALAGPDEQPTATPPAGPSFGDLFDGNRWREAMRASNPATVMASPEGTAVSGGFMHGMTMGAGKLAPGALGDELADLDADAQAASPELYGAADTAGAFANPLRIAGGAANAAKPLARIGGSALSGGLTSGAQAGVRALSDDPDHDVLDALAEGGEAGLWGAGIGGALQGAGEVAGGIGRYASDFGRRMSNKAMGIGTSAVKALRERGINVSAGDLEAMAKRAGLSDGILPRGVQSKLNQLESYGTRGGREMSNAIAVADEMTAVPAPEMPAHLAPRAGDDARSAYLRKRLAKLYEKELGAGGGQGKDFGHDIARDTYEHADDIMLGPGGSRDARASAMSAEARATADQKLESLEDLRKFKTNREAEQYDTPRGVAGDSYTAQAAGFSADRARGLLDEGMQEAGPELYNQFKQGAQAWGDSQTLGRVLQGRSDTLEANPSMWPGADLVKEYAPDAMARGARMAGAPLQAAGDAMTSAAPAGGYAGAALQSWLSDKGVSGPKALPAEVSANAEQLVQSNPQAFGKWSADFQRAQQNGTLDLLIGRLVQSDPEFRNGPYRQLQQTNAIQSQR